LMPPKIFKPELHRNWTFLKQLPFKSLILTA
jgi:hypothetical protein